MQEELPRLSAETGSMEPPQATSRDLSHPGESQSWPHTEIFSLAMHQGEKGLCAHQRPLPERGRWSKDSTTPPDTQNQDPKSRERSDLANGARAFQYLQTQGPGMPSLEEAFILPGDPAPIPLALEVADDLAQSAPGNKEGVSLPSTRMAEL